MGHEVGILVVGLGRIGRMHAANVAGHVPRARLAAVCDTDAAVLDRAEAEYQVPSSSRLEDLIDRPDVDAVLIASPAQTHAAIIRTAAAAGKHIFSEKPVGLTLEECDPVLQAAVDAGIVFQIGFQRRWDADFLEAKRLIAAGAIGRPLLFRAHGHDPQLTGPLQDPATGGGIFLDAAIHDYDAARLLMADEIVRVSSQGAVLLHEHLRALGDLDTCATELTFSGGGLGLTEWNRIAAFGYDVRAEVLGTDGALLIGGLWRRQLTVLDRAGARSDVTPWFAERFAAAYRAELEAFALAVLDGRPATPGIEDARTSLHVALCAREACRSGTPQNVAALTPLGSRRR